MHSLCSTEPIKNVILEKATWNRSRRLLTRSRKTSKKQKHQKQRSPKSPKRRTHSVISVVTIDCKATEQPADHPPRVNDAGPPSSSAKRHASDNSPSVPQRIIPLKRLKTWITLAQSVYQLFSYYMHFFTGSHRPIHRSLSISHSLSLSLSPGPPPFALPRQVKINASDLNSLLLLCHFIDHQTYSSLRVHAKSQSPKVPKFQSPKVPKFYVPTKGDIDWRRIYLPRELQLKTDRSTLQVIAGLSLACLCCFWSTLNGVFGKVDWVSASISERQCGFLESFVCRWFWYV